MYSIGEIIVYGSTGVCRVTDISQQADSGRLYYTLKPLFQACMISAPVGSDKVFMRPVITRDEALSLIDGIPAVEVEAFHSRVTRQLSEHYEAALKRHSCGDLVRLTMSIRKKKAQAEAQKKKLGAVDERYMKRAEELLFGELSVALDIPRDAVADFIAQRVGAA